jgi:hypothetical protein
MIIGTMRRMVLEKTAFLPPEKGVINELQIRRMAPEIPATSGKVDRRYL